MNFLIKMKSVYLTASFFWILAAVTFVFFVSFWFAFLFEFAQFLLIAFLLITFFDLFVLYQKDTVLLAKRTVPERLSNGDENQINIHLKSLYRFKIDCEVIDELPVQFQKRDFLYRLKIEALGKNEFSYFVKPVDRGEYIFGNLNVFAIGYFKLIKRKYTFGHARQVACYPSFVQLRKYEFLAVSKLPQSYGLKKIRRIGHTLEFEQIKDYVVGDDFRTINWKATAKTSRYMVNQYQDETSQPIYSIIDVGRVMKMPFEGLKLLDYAINASLAFSKVAILKKDKAGLMTFSKTVDNSLPASSRAAHMQAIMERLYNIDTQFSDSDFGALHAALKYQLNQRSLLILYTNFEHLSALNRQLPYLAAIARRHLLVVVIFKNTELTSLTEKPSENLWDVYEKTIAEKFESDKKLMVSTLQKHNIQTILTAPKNLTVNAINKYLEIKAKGLF
ncbi:MAG: DUF58 domain-containing protein [Flavobacteriales bacterium CG_4_9_14_3_um_filter_40_17]|nr:MAG: DUF58 domain-containing protein [Flavobacteriales bacterium CG_4_9_14_3_um_filter_40_17]